MGNLQRFQVLKLLIPLSFIFTNCSVSRIILNELGEHNIRKKEYGSALICYKLLILSHKKSSDAYAKRGECYAYLNKYNFAFRDFDKSLQLNPENSFAYYKRGMLKEHIREYYSAKLDYYKALNFNKNQYILYANYGRMCVVMDSCKEAIPYLNIVIEKNAFNSCNTKLELLYFKQKCEEKCQLK